MGRHRPVVAFPDARAAPTRGRPRRDDRTTLGGVFWKLCSGAAWRDVPERDVPERDVPERDVPERDGPYRTVYDRFAKYRDDGTLERVLRALRVRLDAEGHIDHSTSTTRRG